MSVGRSFVALTTSDVVFVFGARDIARRGWATASDQPSHNLIFLFPSFSFALILFLLRVRMGIDRGANRMNVLSDVLAT